MRHTVPLIASAVATALLVAACSSDAEEPVASPTPAPLVEPVVEAVPEPEMTLAEAIDERVYWNFHDGPDLEDIDTVRGIMASDTHVLVLGRVSSTVFDTQEEECPDRLFDVDPVTLENTYVCVPEYRTARLVGDTVWFISRDSTLFSYDIASAAVSEPTALPVSPFNDAAGGPYQSQQLLEIAGRPWYAVGPLVVEIDPANPSRAVQQIDVTTIGSGVEEGSGRIPAVIAAGDYLFIDMLENLEMHVMNVNTSATAELVDRLPSSKGVQTLEYGFHDGMIYYSGESRRVHTLDPVTGTVVHTETMVIAQDPPPGSPRDERYTNPMRGFVMDGAAVVVSGINHDVGLYNVETGGRLVLQRSNAGGRTMVVFGNEVWSWLDDTGRIEILRFSLEEREEPYEPATAGNDPSQSPEWQRGYDDGYDEGYLDGLDDVFDPDQLTSRYRDNSDEYIEGLLVGYEAGWIRGYANAYGDDAGLGGDNAGQGDDDECPPGTSLMECYG